MSLEVQYQGTYAQIVVFCERIAGPISFRVIIVIEVVHTVALNIVFWNLLLPYTFSRKHILLQDRLHVCNPFVEFVVGIKILQGLFKFLIQIDCR